MALDFVAIDFETANSFRGSPCSVGIAEVAAGQVVGVHHWLMRPPAGYDHFEGINVSIHGITAGMVASEPRFAELWPELESLIEGRPLVAHNAGFDMGVLVRALDVSELPRPQIDYYCTMVQARMTYDLPSYSLPYVSEVAGVSLTDHHDASADAVAAAQVMTAIAAHHGATDLNDLCTRTLTRPGRISAEQWRGNTVQRHRSWRTAPPSAKSHEVNSEADPSHPLFGQRVVFTGGLGGLTRDQAFALCARLGIQPQNSVRKDTDILVVGAVSPRFLRPEGAVSGKHQRALALRDKGQQIEIMAGDDFWGLVFEGRSDLEPR